MSRGLRAAAWLLSICCNLLHPSCGTELGNPNEFANDPGNPLASPDNGNALYSGVFFKPEMRDDCPDFQTDVISSDASLPYALPLAADWSVAFTGNPLQITEDALTGSISIVGEVLPVTIENLITYVQLSEPDLAWHQELTLAGLSAVVADDAITTDAGQELVVYFSNGTVILRSTIVLTETGLFAATCMLDRLSFLD